MCLPGCLPYLKFSDPLQETHLFFIWPDTDAIGPDKQIFGHEIEMGFFFWFRNKNFNNALLSGVLVDLDPLLIPVTGIFYINFGLIISILL